MPYHVWKVARLSPGQLLDVCKEDILCRGYARKCDTYRGGGGYDQFPKIAAKRGKGSHRLQFIIQLYGCNLDCPYCYVTREGVWGEFQRFSTLGLAMMFKGAHEANGCTVFHLMGGAPAIQLPWWPELIEALRGLSVPHVFHSDLMLTERHYSRDVLRRIAQPQCLFAVNIKGLTDEEWVKNTRKPSDFYLFWDNLKSLEETLVPYYITFTDVQDTERFWMTFKDLFPDTYWKRRDESFKINLIDYEAVQHVDDVPWGASTKGGKSGR